MGSTLISTFVEDPHETDIRATADILRLPCCRHHDSGSSVEHYQAILSRSAFWVGSHRDFVMTSPKRKSPSRGGEYLVEVVRESDYQFVPKCVRDGECDLYFPIKLIALEMGPSGVSWPRVGHGFSQGQRHFFEPRDVRPLGAP